MTLKILVTGATGNVGRAVVDCLVEMGAPVRAAVRPSELAHTPNLPAGVEITPFDLGDPTTFAPALAGVDCLFLMRPPAITDIEHTIKPFVETAARMGVRHITFLSLIGAESNRLVPHRAVEDLLIAGDVPYTLLRAGFLCKIWTPPTAPKFGMKTRFSFPLGTAAQRLLMCATLRPWRPKR